MQDTRHVKGLADLGKVARALPIKIECNILRGALRAGMAPIRADAKHNAAKATGALASGLKVSTSAKRGTVYAKLRTTGKHDYIARFVEFGTALHVISGRNGKMLRIPQVGRGFAFVRSVEVSARSQAFMRPAIDTQTDAAILAVANYIRNRLTAEGINIPDGGDEA
jgi:HK97 gp10 family phage protein